MPTAQTSKLLLPLGQSPRLLHPRAAVLAAVLQERLAAAGFCPVHMGLAPEEHWWRYNNLFVLEKLQFSSGALQVCGWRERTGRPRSTALDVLSPTQLLNTDWLRLLFVW